MPALIIRETNIIFSSVRGSAYKLHYTQRRSHERKGVVARGGFGSRYRQEVGMKTAKIIKCLREISQRLKELGLPEETLKGLNEWIEKEENPDAKN